MWANALKAIGLAPVQDYIQPRLSIGNCVLDSEFSTGHFKVHVDSQALVLTIKTIRVVLSGNPYAMNPSCLLLWARTISVLLLWQALVTMNQPRQQRVYSILLWNMTLWLPDCKQSQE
ncbi:unnamed protein product [Absidia cylindrospora]